MDYPALRDYILGRQDLAEHVVNNYDAAIAIALNTTRVPVVGSVSRARFSMWCGVTGLRAIIEAHAANATSPLQSIALTIKDFLLGGVADAIDMNDPVNNAMLDAWVQAGALTAGQKADLIALATTEQLVFGSVHHLDIAKALRP